METQQKELVVPVMKIVAVDSKSNGMLSAVLGGISLHGALLFARFATFCGPSSFANVLIASFEV